MSVFQVIPRLETPLYITDEERLLFGDGISYATDTFGHNPDFPRAAELWAQANEQVNGFPIDGVLALDPVFLQTMLGLTGSSVAMSDGSYIDGSNAAQARSTRCTGTTSSIRPVRTRTSPSRLWGRRGHHVLPKLHEAAAASGGDRRRPLKIGTSTSGSPTLRKKICCASSTSTAVSRGTYPSRSLAYSLTMQFGQKSNGTCTCR